MAIPTIGALLSSAINRRVTIQQLSGDRSAFGTDDVSWEDVETRWATIAVAEPRVETNERYRRARHSHRILFREQVRLGMGTYRFVDDVGNVFKPVEPAWQPGQVKCFTSMKVLLESEETNEGAS